MKTKKAVIISIVVISLLCCLTILISYVLANNLIYNKLKVNPISFSDGTGSINSIPIAKIEIESGSTGKLLSTTDTTKISDIMAQLQGEMFFRNWNYKPSSGWDYTINIYPKSGSGYIRFTLGAADNTFESCGGYTGQTISGNYYPQNSTEVEQICDSFFKSLK